MTGYPLFLRARNSTGRWTALKCLRDRASGLSATEPTVHRGPSASFFHRLPPGAVVLVRQGGF